AITASAPADKDALFAPAEGKIYRHPSFFTLPEVVDNMC
ncbi:MAG: 1,2-phenylacetyl-CoA epoxidase subunit B, partial [Pseudomonadota bacterium]|nr:1,2-phenylacetyl-CoA epoxidase subunit B [Pseudomonadota bacterium]